MIKKNKRFDNILNLLTILILIVYFITGLFIFDDYGVTVDEPFERQTGLVNLKFIIKDLLHKPLPNKLSTLPDLKTYEDKDYGIILQFPIILSEYFTNFKHDISSIYKLRHLWTFLNFYISVICFNLLLFQRFRNRLISLLGTLFLIISPRIFAESFYNIKDLMFLSWFIIGLFFLYRFIHHPTYRNSLILAIVIALDSNTRLIGFILLVAACIYLFYAFFTGEISKKEFLINGLILVGLNIFLWFLFIPASWRNPINFLIAAIKHFAKYDHSSLEFYLGKLELSTNLPWHYLPVWIFISTPIFYTMLFFIGIFYLIKRSRNKDLDQIFDYIVLGIFIISFLLPICLHSTLYDGWRHFYFLYGPFLYLAVLGLSALLAIKYTILKSVILGISVGSLIYNGVWMIRNHPYQMVYFNVLVRDKAPYNFERDYWRATSSKCLQYILSIDDDLKIHVAGQDAELSNEKLALNKTDRDRLIIDSWGYDSIRTKYFILNYTRIVGNEKKIYYYEPIYKIQVDGINITTIFERKDRDGVWASDIVKEATSNVSSEFTPLIYDKDEKTGWSTGRFQQKGDYIQFELRDSMILYGLSLLPGSDKYEAPQNLRIEGSQDGINWELFSLIYKTHSDYAFKPTNIRYIKLKLDQDYEKNAWTVNDIIFHVQPKE